MPVKALVICLFTLFFTSCASLLQNSISTQGQDAFVQDESKPIQSVLISELTENDGSPPSKDKFSATIKITRAILPSLRPEQKLIYVGSDKSFARLIQKTGDAKLAHITAPPYAWLQDLMEIGATEAGLAALISYGDLSQKGTVTTLMKAINGSRIPFIKILQSDAVFGTVGGNIEKWPGEIGVIGTSDFSSSDALSSFANQVFQKNIHVLALPTSWLFIGHIDEVIKLLRYKPGDRCEIDFLLNSPDVAKRLLKKEKDGLLLDELEYGEARISQIASIQELCRVSKIQCLRPHNRDVLKAINESSELKSNLELVKRNLSEVKQIIADAYMQRMPHCHVKWVEAPALHLVLKEKTGGLKPRTGRSVFPSLTNGLLINDKYIVADPGSPAFRKGFASIMKDVSLEVVYVPLGEELFRGDFSDGYVHCMTQVIREP